MGEFKESLPAEEVIENGLGILIRQKRLYHGSGVEGIKQLNSAEEATVGEGVYLTSSISDALGYAKRRAKRNEGDTSVVYGAKIENLKLLDLRNKANLTKILEGFNSALISQRRRADLSWVQETAIDKTIDLIASGKVGSLRDVAFSHGKSFTEYVKSLGYDGLITIEGGEGQDIGEHDTYLIFDPNKLKELSVE